MRGSPNPKGRIMRGSSDHILTSHAGSLPRPDVLIEAYRAREAGEAAADRAIEEQLRMAVGEVVRRQRDLGIDIPGDGEYGKSMGHSVNYGAWWRYSFLRLGGLEMGGPGLYELPARRSRPGEVVLTSFADRRDRTRFARAYADPDSGITTGPRPATHPVCVAPLTYTGQDAIAADIARFKAALAAAGVEEGFMTSIARRAPRGSAMPITRPRRSSSTPAPMRCARSTRQSSTPGSFCNSTIPRSPRIGTRSTPSPASRTTGNSRWSGSRR